MSVISYSEDPYVRTGTSILTEYTTAAIHYEVQNLSDDTWPIDATNNTQIDSLEVIYNRRGDFYYCDITSADSFSFWNSSDFLILNFTFPDDVTYRTVPIPVYIKSSGGSGLYRTSTSNRDTMKRIFDKLEAFVGQEVSLTITDDNYFDILDTIIDVSSSGNTTLTSLIADGTEVLL